MLKKLKLAKTVIACPCFVNTISITMRKMYCSQKLMKNLRKIEKCKHSPLRSMEWCGERSFGYEPHTIIFLTFIINIHFNINEKNVLYKKLGI